jgi:hypothetical protein
VLPGRGGGGLRPHLSFGSRWRQQLQSGLHGGPGLSACVPEQNARAQVGAVWQCGQ